MPSNSSAPFIGVPQMRPPLAFLPLYIGTRPGMTFSQRSRTVAQNAASWLMLIFGGVFVVWSGMLGNTDYVGINCAFISVGATSLWLSAIGFRHTALAVISAGSTLVFFFGALWFRNGMENYLLVTMAASLLLFDSAWTRVSLGGLSAAAYSFVKLAPALSFGSGASAAGGTRHALSIILFLLALAGLIEFFRVLNSDYVEGLEETNRELEKANTSKEKLFSVIAHDLRGPIGNLKISLDLLEGGEISQSEFAAVARDLAADVDHSYACLENLLAWSAAQLRGISAKAVPVPISSAWDQCAKLSAFSFRKKSIRVSCDVPGGAAVLVDPQHFPAILRNLVSNAVKFTPVGGSLSFSAKRDGEFWEMCVSDNGVGMPQEQAAALFRPGSHTSTPGTEREQGLGLGLEICREFVAINGGIISAESNPGQGTRVRFRLPAHTDSAAR